MSYRESTYATIDIDSWHEGKVDVEAINRILSRVPKADRAAAIHHDSVLSHVRRYARSAKRVVNVDYHSDLGGCLDATFENGKTGLRRLELHSGSWADYVELDDKQEYVWASLGPGMRTDHFSLERPFSQVQQVGRSPWRKIRHVLVKSPGYGLSNADIDGISIVLSPDCCGDDAFKAFVELVHRHDLELLDCLPQDLDVERLRSVGERMKKARNESRSEPPLATRSEPEVPRAVLRLCGLRCKTMGERRKATEKFLSVARMA
jgi:hypothetical protein